MRNNHKISVDITRIIYKYELFWSKINNNFLGDFKLHWWPLG
jgi:hypothetical protein